MLADIKKKWVKALRSGHYQQTRGCLKNTDNGKNRYCVLGVLCNVFNRRNWTKEDSYKYNGMVGDGDLPKNLRNKLRLPCWTTNKLINMNDVQRKSFKDLTDWIEKNIPESY